MFKYFSIFSFMFSSFNEILDTALKYLLNSFDKVTKFRIVKLLTRYNHDNNMFFCGRNPKGDKNISMLMKGIKSYTAKQIHEVVNWSGSIWQKSFFYSIVGNKKRLKRVVYYIRNNPKKDNLIAKYYKIPYMFIDYDIIRFELQKLRN